MRNALIILFSFSILFSADGKAYSVDLENATLKWTANSHQDPLGIYFNEGRGYCH